MDNFLKYVILFIPSAILSGFFYAKVLLVLRKGKHSKSKAHLVRVLCVLWLSWVVVNAPLAGWEIALQSVFKIGNSDNKDLMHWTAWRVDSVVSRALVLVR